MLRMNKDEKYNCSQKKACQVRKKKSTNKLSRKILEQMLEQITSGSLQNLEECSLAYNNFLAHAKLIKTIPLFVTSSRWV